MGPNYSPLPSTADDVQSTTLADKKGILRSSNRWSQISFFAWLATTLLWTFTILSLGVRGSRPARDAECGQQLSTYSPMMDAVEYEKVQFENAFHHKSRYRGSPTPELEQAWLDLWNFGAINVPFDKLGELNKSEEVSWKRVSPEHGGGVSALIEVFHQIHCLDLVRQYTYRDEYDYSHLAAFDAPQHLVRAHVDHCIETIRINLMCTGDVTPYLMKLSPGRLLGEAPDFNSLHTCRNFTKLQEWARQNAVPSG